MWPWPRRARPGGRPPRASADRTWRREDRADQRLSPSSQPERTKVVNDPPLKGRVMTDLRAGCGGRVRIYDGFRYKVVVMPPRSPTARPKSAISPGRRRGHIRICIGQRSAGRRPRPEASGVKYHLVLPPGAFAPLPSAGSVVGVYMSRAVTGQTFARRGTGGGRGRREEYHLVAYMSKIDIYRTRWRQWSGTNPRPRRQPSTKSYRIALRGPVGGRRPERKPRSTGG